MKPEDYLDSRLHRLATQVNPGLEALGLGMPIPNLRLAILFVLFGATFAARSAVPSEQHFQAITHILTAAALAAHRKGDWK
jgi:hypothetical protein